jgi:hypothetical protein
VQSMRELQGDYHNEDRSDGRNLANRAGSDLSRVFGAGIYFGNFYMASAKALERSARVFVGATPCLINGFEGSLPIGHPIAHLTTNLPSGRVRADAYVGKDKLAQHS